MRQTGSVKILRNGDAHEKKKRVIGVTTSWVEVVHMALLHESRQVSVFTSRIQVITWLCHGQNVEHSLRCKKEISKIRNLLSFAIFFNGSKRIEKLSF